MENRGRVIVKRKDGEEDKIRWEFDHISDVKTTAKEDLRYKIYWKYYTPFWQPAEDLEGAEDSLLKFHSTHRRAKPSKFLFEWIRQCYRLEPGEGAYGFAVAITTKTTPGPGEEISARAHRPSCDLVERTRLSGRAVLLLLFFSFR